MELEVKLIAKTLVLSDNDEITSGSFILVGRGILPLLRNLWFSELRVTKSSVFYLWLRLTVCSCHLQPFFFFFGV